MRRIVLLPSLMLSMLAAPALAADVSVAVAANFTKPAEELGAAFTARTGDSVTFSFGATGALYTQITQGAPFEVFLSADAARPAQAIADGFAVDGSAFTYSVGRLVLYSPMLDLTDGEAVLEANAFEHLVHRRPGDRALRGGGARGDRQAGAQRRAAAEAGHGAEHHAGAAVRRERQCRTRLRRAEPGDRPARDARSGACRPTDHAPILQDAVLLRAGEADPAAKAFLEFLKSKEARAIIGRYGYEAGSDS